MIFNEPKKSVAADVTSRAYASRIVSSVFFTFASTYRNILGAIVAQIGPPATRRGNMFQSGYGDTSKVVSGQEVIVDRQPLSRH